MTKYRLLLLCLSFPALATENDCGAELARRFAATKYFDRLTGTEIQDPIIRYRPFLAFSADALFSRTVYDLMAERLRETKIPFAALGGRPRTNINFLGFSGTEGDSPEAIVAQMRRLAFVKDRYTLLIDLSPLGPAIFEDRPETRKFWRRIRAARDVGHPVQPAALMLVIQHPTLRLALEDIRDDKSEQLLRDLKFGLVDLDGPK